MADDNNTVDENGNGNGGGSTFGTDLLAWVTGNTNLIYSSFSGGGAWQNYNAANQANKSRIFIRNSVLAFAAIIVIYLIVKVKNKK